MYYVLFQNKKNDDSSVYIKHSYSVNGVKKQMVIEKYPSINELTKIHGDWKTFIEDRIKELNDERKNKKEETSVLTLNFSKKLTSDNELSKNVGYLLLQKCYYNLGIDQFLYHYKNNNHLKIKYSLNDVMKLLTYSRIITPGSKLHTSKKNTYYAEEFDVSLDDIYDSLDRFNDVKEKLQDFLYKKVKSICPPSDTVIYYDATNFYYEVENESDLIAYGVEKNHRPDPIVSFGLFMDSNGMPIRYSAYRGNISESKQMLPTWSSLRNELGNNSYVICTDSAMNTADIKKYILDCGDNYIVSQSPLKLDKFASKALFEDTGWKTFEKGKKYKVRKTIKDSNVHSDKSTRKDGKITVGLDTEYIFIFDQKRRDFILRKIDERVARANEIISNPSKFDKVSSKSGKQYINKITYDSNGEIIVEESQLIINEELIEKEKKYAGYGVILTNMFDMEILDVLKIASRRNEIEDCFRQMKTGFSTRPVYLYKTEHIHAHFLTCYIALTMLKLLENYYLKEYTASELLSILRDTTFAMVNESSWLACNVSTNAINAFTKMGFESLMYEAVSNKNLNKIITLSKNK